jgi:succinyl-CoA synthetase alpha subunit
MLLHRPAPTRRWHSVPPRFAADSILAGDDAGIELIITTTEGIPAHDELRVFNPPKQNLRSRSVAPNHPGIGGWSLDRPYIFR